MSRLWAGFNHAEACWSRNGEILSRRVLRSNWWEAISGRGGIDSKLPLWPPGSADGAFDRWPERTRAGRGLRAGFFAEAISATRLGGSRHGVERTLRRPRPANPGIADSYR